MYKYTCIYTIYTYIHIHRHIHIYTYTYTLVTWYAERVIFEWCILRQYQSIHFKLPDLYMRLLSVMVNECAQIVKDSNV